MLPPRIVTILDRLRQDLADDLTPDAIKLACNEEKYSCASGCSTPSPPSTSSSSRSSTATPPVNTPSTSEAGTSPTALTAPRASDSPWASSTASWGGSLRPAAQPVTHRHGSDTVSGCSTGPASPCPTLPSCKRRSANPAASAAVAGSRWPSSWRSSTSPPACFCGSRRPRCGRTRCPAAPSSAPTCRPATLSSGTAAFAHSLILRFYSTASCTGCSASPEANHRLHPRSAAGVEVEGEGEGEGVAEGPGVPAALAVGGGARQVGSNRCLVQAEI